MEEVNIGGVRYISSKRASEMSDYSQDYIGQLARSGSIDAKRLSGLWYISFESLQTHKTKAENYVPQPPQRKTNSQTHKPADTSISFDGRSYISSARASKVTGYHADYVTQLAREGKILSKQVGNRWFVDQEAVVGHKKEKDALLAAVQVESVGLQKMSARVPVEKKSETDALAPINYFKEEERDLMPQIGNSSQNIDSPVSRTPVLTKESLTEIDSESTSGGVSSEQRIPIRVLQTPLESRPKTPTVLVPNRIAARKSPKSFIWASFAGAAAVGVVLVAYIGVVPGYQSFSLEGSAQYASVSTSIERLGGFLEEVFTEELSFSR